MKQQRVAVIATIRNEERTIDDLIRSLLVQTRAPDEIVLSDGGSTDATVAIVQRWIERGAPLHLLSCPGANIAAGRNRAIAAATADLIASTDAGARLDPRWLERLVAPFEDGFDVVMGFFVAAPQTLFERALAATTLPDVDEIAPERFIPSSRSIAFTRTAWQKVEGYPEWLDYCEDVVFDLRLRESGFRFAWARDAVVYYRPRSTVGAYFRQYYLYARGDGKANLWPRRHAARYITYIVAPLVTMLGFCYKRAWLMLGIGAAIYLSRPYRRLARALDGLGPLDRLLAIALVPILRVVGDLAKIVGYPVGVRWRMRHEKNDG